MKSNTSRKKQISGSGNSNSGNSNSFSKGRSTKTGLVALCAALLCSLLTAQPSRGEVYQGELVHFRPPSGQPLFPGGNLNVFKQLMVTVDEEKYIGGSCDKWIFGDYGAYLGGHLDAAFGLEFGLCLGGNATFDLGFQPSIALPEKYPYDTPIPLNVSAQLLETFKSNIKKDGLEGKEFSSNFKTVFPPLGQMYADLILDVDTFAGVTLNSPFYDGPVWGTGLNTCDIPLLVPNSDPARKLFRPSTRCDPSLIERARCGIELFSFNRDSSDNLFGGGVNVTGNEDGDAVVRMLNLAAKNRFEFLLKPYLELPLTYDSSDSDPSASADNLRKELDRVRQEAKGGRYGKIEFSIPTVATDSNDTEKSNYNTCDILRSSGEENVLFLGLDLAAIISSVLPPPLPPLSASGKVDVGIDIEWDYTIASLNLGPQVALKTDFEMTWDLVVTEMTFSDPVKVVGYGQDSIGVTKFIPSPGQVHLTNCGPKALPMIQLPKDTDGLDVEVEIKYVMQPKLKTKVSLPIYGSFNYEFFAAGVKPDYIGRLGFGPVVEGEQKYSFGDFTVYESVLPTPIKSEGIGSIKFTMKSSGPPSYDWNPSQSGNADNLWTYTNNNKTNWLETTGGELMTSYPGFNNTNSSFARIARDDDDRLDPKLFDKDLDVASLQIVKDNYLTIAGAELGVVGGLLENSGNIIIANSPSITNAALGFDGPAGIVCGDGVVNLLVEGASLKGSSGESFNFCNFNTIKGRGQAMNQYGVSQTSYIKNDGTFAATLGVLETSANTFENLWQLEASKNSTLKVSGDELVNRLGSVIRPGGNVSSSGEGASVLLNFDSIEHSGQMSAESGGALRLAPKNKTRGTMQAGLSTEGNGYVTATGKDDKGKSSIVELDKMDITGGCFFAMRGGSIEATGGTGFTGSMFHIGNEQALTDENSGTLTLTTGNFNNICLSNFGTVRVMDNSDVDFSQNVVFTNHGRVVVSPGATLNISEDQVDILGDEAPMILPGTTNATASRTINLGQNDETTIGGTLMGGSWDVAGKLFMGGASFNAIGGNSATPCTASGSIDAEGNRLSDPGEGGGRAISNGNPAIVTLRGINYDFPALYDLRVNRGSFTLTEGANFPKDLYASTGGDFVNNGKLEINPNSQMNIGGSFIQSGDDAKTTISGALNIDANDYQILGGTFDASQATGDVLGITSSNSIPAGTSILVRSVRTKAKKNIYTGTPDSQPARVVINLGLNKKITSIADGATLEIDGNISEKADGTTGIYFPGLNGLLTNHGTLTLTCGYGGVGNLLKKTFGDDTNGFTNTGQIKVTGPGTKITFKGFLQSEADSEIYVGSNSEVVFGSSSSISAGRVTVEISQRSPTGRFKAPDTLGAWGGRINSFGILTLGDKLAINFSGDLTKSVDIGDSWDIAPRSKQVTIDKDQVTWLVDGKPMPTDWLPEGSELKIIQYQYQNDPQEPKKGLTIRVAPKGGFTDYRTWAMTALNKDPTLTYLADPYSDANGDGVSNALEFFFGLDGVSRTMDQVGEAALVNRDDGQYFELSFVRPIGVDASYAPYVSTDLKTWALGRMLVKGITPGPGEGFERVTLETSATYGISRLFFRIQPSFNPDNFYPGQLPYQPYGNPINWSSGLENFAGSLFYNAQYPENYKVQPGRVFYLNTTGSDQGKNSLYGGTASDGSSRNYMYYASSPVAAAAMHAGLLDNGEKGFLKVTFMEPQATYTGSPQQSPNGQTITSGTKTPGATFNDYSYKLELVGIANLKTPSLSWKPFQITQARPAGNPLSTNDLNAEVSADGNSLLGTYVYDPPLGTPIEADPGARTMTLKVTFYPEDSLRYRTVSKLVIINVSSPAVTSN